MSGRRTRSQQEVEQLLREMLEPRETRMLEVPGASVKLPVIVVDLSGRPDVASWLRAVRRGAQITGACTWHCTSDLGPPLALLLCEVRRPARMRFHLAFLTTDEGEEQEVEAIVAAGGRVGLADAAEPNAEPVFLTTPVEKLAAFLAQPKPAAEPSR
jgi:hypothetical protein